MFILEKKLRKKKENNRKNGCDKNIAFLDYNSRNSYMITDWVTV